MIVDELVTLLSFDTGSSEEDGKKFQKNLNDIKGFAKKMGLAIVGATTAITAYTVHVAKSVDETGKFADSIDVSVEKLQELEFAVQRSGGTVQDLRSDLANLTSSMSSPIPGEFNQELFLLGVSARDASGKLKSADQVLLDLSEKFENFSDIKAQQFGQRLGFSQGTIRLLQQGSGAIEELAERRRRLGDIFTEEDTQKSAEFVDSMTDLNTATGAFFKRIALDLSPAIKDLVDGFIDLFLSNKSLIRSGIMQFIQGLAKGFKTFFNIISSVVDRLLNMLSPIREIFKGFNATNSIAGIVSTTLLVLTGIMTAFIARTVAGLAVATAGVIRFGIAFALANAPIIAVTALIAGVVLIMEDLFTLFTGGDSLIGRFFTSIGDKITEFTDRIMKKIKVFVDFVKNSAVGKFLGLDEEEPEAQQPGGALGRAFGEEIAFRNAQAGFAQVPPSAMQNNRGGDQNTTIVVNGTGSPESVANSVIGKAGLQNVQQIGAPGINAGVFQ